MRVLFSLLIISFMFIGGTLSAERGGGGGHAARAYGGARSEGFRPMGPRPDSLEQSEFRNAPDNYPYYGEGAFFGDPYFGGAYQENYNYRDNPMYQEDVLKNVRSGEDQQIEDVENMEQEPDIG